jgi:hypothetical protein
MKKKKLFQNFSLFSPVSLTFIREYLREFSKKFEMVLKGYSGARGTLIYEKKSDVENLVSDSL